MAILTFINADFALGCQIAAAIKRRGTTDNEEIPILKFIINNVLQIPTRLNKSAKVITTIAKASCNCAVSPINLDITLPDFVF